MKNQDLMYFGYEFESNSKILEEEFIVEIKEKFPNVILKDAYDDIKGYRQEIYLEEDEIENYWSWLIAYGWFNYSLNGQLMLIDINQDARLKKYLDLAKLQYLDKMK